MKLSIRLLADCDTLSTADELAVTLCREFACLSPLSFLLPKPFWKSADIFELNFTLYPFSQNIFYQIMKRGDERWMLLGPEPRNAAIWIKSERNMFLAPEISWVKMVLH